jgi:uncharacterized protein
VSSPLQPGLEGTPPVEATEPKLIAPPAAIPREAPVFGFLDVALALFGAILAIMVSNLLALGIARALPRFSGLSIQQLAKVPAVVIPAQVVAYILVVGFIHLLLYLRYHQGLTEAIPFRWPRQNWAMLAAAGVALAFAVLVLGRFLPMPKQLPIEEFFKDRTSAFIMLGFGVLIAPVVEELFFRGLLYPVLNRSLGPWFALTVTSLLFAMLHAGQLALAWAPLMSLFLVGMALTVVRARFQSVAASTVVHMSYNAALFGVLFWQTGGFRNMEVLTR